MDSKDYLKNVKVIKKDGNLQNYDFNKIIVAINKSARDYNPYHGNAFHSWKGFNQGSARSG